MAKSTKQLARELGFLRKRSLSSRNNKEQTSKPKQLFAYLVVLDFESTCWKDARHRTQEIIEFPAVLMDTTTGRIESEFHFYVQPQECPTLSDFCRELTGITQDQVDEGIPLGIVLRKFSSWLRKNSETHNFQYNVAPEGGKLCTFVTWSDWDLGVCLLYEARRKQLRKPADLCSWIDLRAMYRKFYERTPKGLNGALQDVGLGFEGREHSGIDDAKNTAHLAFRMIKDGCIMKITKTIQGPESAKQHAKNNKVIAGAVSTRTVSAPTSGAVPLRSSPRSKMSSNLPKDSIPLQEQQNIGTSKLISSKPAPKRAFSSQAGVSRVNAAQNHLIKDNGPSAEGKPVSKGERYAQSPPPKKNKIEPCRKFSIFQDDECGKPTGMNKGPSMALRDTTNINMSTAANRKEGHFKTPTTILKENSSTKVQGNLRSPSENGMLSSNNGSFKTPLPISRDSAQRPSLMKATPPMCMCGRRSKRKFAQSIGPNQGRSFFCCGVERNQRTASKGCAFFKWEPENQNIGTSPVLAESVAKYFVRSSSVQAMNKVESGRSCNRLPQPDFGTPQLENRMKCGYQATKKTLGLKVLGNSSVHAVVSKV